MKIKNQQQEDELRKRKDVATKSISDLLKEKEEAERKIKEYQMQIVLEQQKIEIAEKDIKSIKTELLLIESDLETGNYEQLKDFTPPIATTDLIHMSNLTVTECSLCGRSSSSWPCSCSDIPSNLPFFNENSSEPNLS